MQHCNNYQGLNPVGICEVKALNSLQIIAIIQIMEIFILGQESVIHLQASGPFFFPPYGEHFVNESKSSFCQTARPPLLLIALIT